MVGNSLAAIGLLSSTFQILVSAQGGGGGGSVSFADGVVFPATPSARSGISVTHGTFTGTPSITGALTASATLGPSISPKPPAASATTYPSDGRLHDAMPAPFVPGGGLGTNGTTPVYNAKSDFDYQSLVCATYPSQKKKKKKTRTTRLQFEKSILFCFVFLF